MQTSYWPIVNRLLILGGLVFNTLQAQEPPIARLSPKILTLPGRTTVRDRTEIGSLEHGHSIRKRWTVAHGVMPWMGVRLEVPLWLDFKVGRESTSGPGDVRALIDWNVLVQDTFAIRLTTGLKLPTGEHKDIIPLGTGTLDADLELSTIFLSNEWFMASLIGTFQRLTHTSRRFGSLYFWQFDVAKILVAGYRKRLIIGFEQNVVHARPNRLGHIIDTNSGGTVMLFGPFLGWGRPGVLLVWYTDIPVVQNLHGKPRIKLNFQMRFDVQVSF